MEKKCGKCEIIKNEEFFYKNKSKKDNLSGYCKQCFKNFERHNLELAKEWYEKWKSEQGCIKCKDTRHYVLDLHHVNNRRNGNKYRLLSRIISSGTASFETRKKKILEEAKHCVILCANCHREEHYMEKQIKSI